MADKEVEHESHLTESPRANQWYDGFIVPGRNCKAKAPKDPSWLNVAATTTNPLAKRTEKKRAAEAQ
jgi:hypothetical protein